jgi:hypothetical protein
MPTAITVRDSFLSSAYDLPKEIAKKIFKALKSFVSNSREDARMGGCSGGVAHRLSWHGLHNHG